jgi:hypothetical protein
MQYRWKRRRTTAFHTNTRVQVVGRVPEPSASAVKFITSLAILGGGVLDGLIRQSVL